MNDTSINTATESSLVAPSVQFNVSEEFLTELARDRLNVDRRVVRVTCSVRRPDVMIRYQELRVLAGYLVATDVGGLQLVELDYTCGPVNGDKDDDVPVRALAATELAAIGDAIATAGLECRAGRFVGSRS